MSNFQKKKKMKPNCVLYFSTKCKSNLCHEKCKFIDTFLIFIVYKKEHYPFRNFYYLTFLILTFSRIIFPNLYVSYFQFFLKILPHKFPISQKLSPRATLAEITTFSNSAPCLIPTYL